MRAAEAGDDERAEQFHGYPGRAQARSMVITPMGIAATSQTLASQAGAQVLARGGSAVDAAIAANATLGVVEPMSNGMGGDLFAICWDAKTGTLTGLNGSGWAPAGLNISFLKSLGRSSMPREGIHSVTVPGCVSGWQKLHQRFGRLPWKDLFQPAIYFAGRGYPVTEIIQASWQVAVPKLAADANARRIFLDHGAAPQVGQVFHNSELAEALRLIASEGPGAFYRGPISKSILKTSDRLGGKMTAADLSEFEAEWVEPMHTEYRGWKVYELPPNGQGIAALEMLNIMETFPLGEHPHLGADDLHIKIEAKKLAYADLARFVADPRFSKVPMAGMVDKGYARQRARLIDLHKAACLVQPGQPGWGAGDTIYLSMVDREGNIVSLIQSLFQGFGSGVVVDDFGFHFQNRGGLFLLDETHPDALQPRKRPLHTIIPAFMEKGETHVGFGIMGGFNQAQAHAQFVSHVVDAGMNIQAALEAPRFTKLTFAGCDVMIEGRVPPEVRRDLEARGHKLTVMPDYAQPMGGGQAVLHDARTRVNYGASSPRKDGAAVPEPAPYFG